MNILLIFFYFSAILKNEIPVAIPKPQSQNSPSNRTRHKHVHKLPEPSFKAIPEETKIKHLNALRVHTKRI